MTGLKSKLSAKAKITLVIVFLLSLITSATVAKIRQKPQTNLIQGQETLAEETLGTVSELDSQTENITMTKTPTPQPTNTVPTPLTTKKVKIGIVVNDYANQTGTIPSLENSLGSKFSSVTIYKQFGHPSNNKLIQSDLAYIKQSGKTLIITWEPWNPSEGNGQSKNYLAEIVSGDQDSYITEFANSVKAYGSPVILRFAHEMNGNWYPWGNRPEEYKNAYIRIVNIFRNNGVSNASYNWSINSDSVPYEPISSVSKFYPGNSYVDSISIDGYNRGTTSSTGWRTFSQIFNASYNYLTSTYNKPLFIAETGSSEEGGSKAAWITQMFNDLGTKYPKISEIVWFNLIKETDWRIDSTPSSMNAFKQTL